MCSNIALGIFLTTSSAGAGEDQVSDLIERGETLLSQQKFKRAKSAFRRAARLSPEGSFPAQVGLTRAALGRGDTREAEKAAKRAIELASRPIERSVGYNLLGLSLFRAGTTSGLIRFTDNGDEPTKWGREIEASFRKAVDSGGNEPTLARYNLAEVLYILDRVPEARAQLQRYLQLTGPAADSDAQRLAECLEGVVEMDPADPDVIAPIVISNPSPEYSESALRRRIEGSTVIVAVLDEHGRLNCPRVVKVLSHGLSEATLKAMHGWKFEPARVHGKPVKVRYAFETRFNVF